MKLTGAYSVDLLGSLVVLVWILLLYIPGTILMTSSISEPFDDIVREGDVGSTWPQS